MSRSPAPPPDFRNRPLHWIAQGSDAADPCLLQYLRSRSEAVWLLGGTPMEDLARSAGWPIGTPRVSLPGGRLSWGLRRLRRLWRRLGSPTDLHAWSICTLRGLVQLNPSVRSTLHLLTPPCEETSVCLRRIDNGRIHLAPITQWIAEQWRDRGWPADRIRVEPLALPTGPPPADRYELRAGWGVGPDEPVVALLSDPPGRADARVAMMAVNLTIEASGRPLRLLTHPRQTGRIAAQHTLRLLGASDRLIQDPRSATPWRVLAGCDAGLLLDRSAALSARHAVGVDLPLVAPDRPMHRADLANYAAVHYAPSAEPKKLADRLHHQALRLPGVKLPPLQMST